MTLRVTLASIAVLVLLVGCERASPASAGPRSERAPVASEVTPATPSAAAPPTKPTPTQPTPAPPPSRFSGTYVGGRLALTITPSATPEREGTLRIRAVSYPFRAIERGGELKGTFTAGGKERGFVARLGDDGTIVLTADGRSFELTRPAAAEPWSGRYVGADQRSVLVLTRAGEALRGRIEMEGQRHALVGTVAQDAVRGTITDPRTGVDHPFRATRSEADLTFVVHTVTSDRTSLRTLIFKR